MQRALVQPEILAPAGTLETFAAVLTSGADAVYLGLSEGFNARARSSAFSLDNLRELVLRAHRANVKLYLTLNTLVFENELDQLEGLLRRAIECGVDALIVQDPATALLARQLSPTIRLHASTQMTISSVEGALFAAGLGVDRVVLPRELNTEEIARFVRQSPLEAEVFVHGALCMAWSGQCLTSEAFSGRSANRGQCSQACRMPYEAIVDGQKIELGDKRYLLSPQDLAAHDALPELMKAGVSSLKIEGRYKGPAYVATAVESWKNWRKACLDGPSPQDTARLVRDTERSQLTFSRGASLGFLGGDNHQKLVVATTPKHRGMDLGTVTEVRQGRNVLVTLAKNSRLPDLVRPGLGVMFELRGRSDNEFDPERAPGGPIFGVRFPDKTRAELTFGQPGPDLKRVRPGDVVRLTGDPEISQSIERQLALPLIGRTAVTLTVSGRAGVPLEVRADVARGESNVTACARTRDPLAPSRSAHGLDHAILIEKLGGLGSTPFFLANLNTDRLDAGLHVRVSELKELRRQIVQALEHALFEVQSPGLSPEPALAAIRRRHGPLTPDRPSLPRLVPLCRTQDQLEAVITGGVEPGDEVELDWMEMVGLTQAVNRARAAGLQVTLATVRVQKPGEEAYDRRIGRLEPNGVLVRHWGALMHFVQERAQGEKRNNNLHIHGDFSLNVTNSVTARHLLDLGLETVTASHDLNRAQLLELLENTPRGRVAVTLHHHIPTFHNSHCVYAHLLSQGTDYKTCGRPCEKHRLALRDYAGHEHPVVVDVSCRNTVFNALAQSAAPLVPRLVDLGVQRFRLELVWETGEEVLRTLLAYKSLLLGRITPKQALEAAAVHERYGITSAQKLKNHA